MKKRVLFSIGLLICTLLTSQKTEEVNPFRIYPYLQVYGKGKIQITWFSNSQTSSSIKLIGSAGSVVYEGEVVAESVPDIYYTSPERNQVINGLEQGSWIESEQVFRYRFSIDLPADMKVDYIVTLAGTGYFGAFTMPTSRSSWEKIRFIALADSETDPKGRVTNRTWYPGKPLLRPFAIPGLWKEKFGTTTEQGIELPNYFLTEEKGYAENLKIINSREPNFIIMPGDLVQGGGYQPAWDEFFRQNAGVNGSGLSSYAIIPALGNWEAYGGINGEYGTNEKGEFIPVVGRKRFHAYFETPTEDPLQKHRQSYYRVDYGPVTILTLDSSNGMPDQTSADFDGQTKLTGRQFTVPGTDTQEHYTQAQYNSAGGNDLSGFGQGSDQYIWLEENLKDASGKGQLIFVQYHHIAYSSGEHGVPMNHELSVGQVGTPMRVLNPMLEEYGVVAVFSGHDELFERSFVDENNDGKGILYYDVGVAGDGLRGEKRDWLGNLFNVLDYNQYRKWSADQSAEEQWNTSGVNSVLTDGGKHYGHLEVNLEKIIERDQEYALINFIPVYAFPVMDQNYNLQKVERRVYKDEVMLKIPLRKTAAKPVVKEKIELELVKEGKATLNPEQVFAEWPISPEFTVELSKSAFTCEDLWSNTVFVKIIDSNGTVAEEEIEVIVRDKSNPVLVTKNVEAVVDLSIGKAEFKPEDFIASLTDNCGIKEVNLSRQSVGCEEIGKEITVEVGAIDYAGNVMQKLAKVMVKSSNSKPLTINGPSSICMGVSQTLTLTSEAEFEVVRWRRNGTEISGAIGKILAIEEGGSYHAIVRYAGGCLFETAKFEVESLAKPSGEIAVDGNILSAPEGIFTYQWFRNGDIIDGAIQRTLTVNQVGEYAVELTNEANCMQRLESVTVTISGLFNPGILVSEELKIYPNPASSEVEIQALGDLKFAENSMRIYNSSGKEVSSKVEVVHQGPSKVTLAISRLTAGTYLIRMESMDNRVFVGKMIKH